MAAVGAVGAIQLVTAGVAVASTIQQTREASKAASAASAAQTKKNDQIVESTIANYDQLSEAELESQNRALDDSLSMQKSYLQSKGRINVMAAVMGTGGQSVSSQLNDLNRTKYSNYNTILQSRQADLDNIADQATNIRYNASASADTRPISRPSWASAALSIGGTVANAYSQNAANKESQALQGSAVVPKEKSGV